MGPPRKQPDLEALREEIRRGGDRTRRQRLGCWGIQMAGCGLVLLAALGTCGIGAPGAALFVMAVVLAVLALIASGITFGIAAVAALVERDVTTHGLRQRLAPLRREEQAAVVLPLTQTEGDTGRIAHEL